MFSYIPNCFHNIISAYTTSVSGSPIRVRVAILLLLWMLSVHDWTHSAQPRWALGYDKSYSIRVVIKAMYVYSSRYYVQSSPPRQSIEDYCHGERSILCNTVGEPGPAGMAPSLNLLYCRVSQSVQLIAIAWLSRASHAVSCVCT